MKVFVQSDPKIVAICSQHFNLVDNPEDADATVYTDKNYFLVTPKKQNKKMRMVIKRDANIEVEELLTLLHDLKKAS